MPICTYLAEPPTETSNKDINETLVDLNRLSSRKWLIQEFVEITGWLRKKERRSYELLLHIQNNEYQVINFYHQDHFSLNTYVSAEMVVAYMMGAIGTLTDMKAGRQP